MKLMGRWRFSRGMAVAAVQRRLFSSVRSPTPSSEKTQILSTLFEIPVEKRDDEWRSLFCMNVSEASFRLGSPEVQEGPDKFPYLHLCLPESNVPFPAYSIEFLRESVLINNGLGIVIESSEGKAEWVFSHGDVLNLHLNNEYFTQADPSNSRISSSDTDSKLVIEAGTNMLVGAPSDVYLPTATRTAIRNFLERSGVSNPKVTLLALKAQASEEDNDNFVRELCFYCDENTFQKDMNLAYKDGVSWYLPRHYKYLFADKDDDEFDFKDL